MPEILCQGGNIAHPMIKHLAPSTTVMLKECCLYILMKCDEIGKRSANFGSNTRGCCIAFATELTMRQLGWPTIQRLTRLSSPPVTRVRPLVGLSARQFTFDVCAANSPAAG